MIRSPLPITCQLAQYPLLACERQHQCEICGSVIPRGWSLAQLPTGEQACSASCIQRSQHAKALLQELLDIEDWDIIPEPGDEETIEVKAKRRVKNHDDAKRHCDAQTGLDGCAGKDAAYLAEEYRRRVARIRHAVFGWPAPVLEPWRKLQFTRNNTGTGLLPWRVA